VLSRAAAQDKRRTDRAEKKSFFHTVGSLLGSEPDARFRLLRIIERAERQAAPPLFPADRSPNLKVPVFNGF
jgi:hypothetical protein